MPVYKLIRIAVLLFIITPLCILAANGVVEKGSTAYLSNTVVVKYKSSAGLGKQSAGLSTAVANMMQPYGLTAAKPLLSVETKHKSTINNIVVIEYSSDIDPVQLSSKLKTLDEIEWAEPRYLRQVNYTPNDSLMSRQYALAKINAAGAWDISMGDTSIIIGIVDTGVDWDHPDLAANIWINKNEIPGNGIDDDNNGYIDDVRGWDFGGLTGTPDNNPMEDAPYHGTHVAGIASAVTNNGKGVASIGYNCKIMAVKTAQDNLKNSEGQPYITYGDEGIVYAVDNGARIINCSYGGSGYSALDQEMVNYAVQNNVLIVAAAGNDNSSDIHYPSGYNGVLSVAATDANDKRASYSNYGVSVDVSAPGSDIYSTWQNNTYKSLPGTSMASPLAAGLAGLVASVFPSYTPAQIAEQIRVNTDNIDSKNPSYIKMIGTGRINAYKALSNTNSIAVRAVDYTISDEAPGGNANGIPEAGETITIEVKFMNYLNPTSGLTVNLQSMNNNAVVKNGTFTAGTVAPLDSFDNASSRFTVYLPDTVAKDAELLFSLNYTDGSYSDFQLFKSIANPTYGTQSGNNITLTLTSNGAIGFNDYPENLQGKGFHYLDGDNTIFEGALILGTAANKISDAARDNTGSERKHDFSVIEPLQLNIPGEIADQQGIAVFNDDNAGTNKLGVTVTMESYSFNSEADKNYILLKYSIANNSGADINNMYAGLFFDWDMVNGKGDNDVTAFDKTGRFGYVFHKGGNPDNYVGSALVSSDLYGFYGVSNDGSDSSFSIYDGFSDLEKWNAISGGVVKDSAGPGDISNVTSEGPFNIPAGAVHRTVFAIGAAPDLEQLRTSFASARAKISIISGVSDNKIVPLTYSLEQNYPNPFNPNTTISFRLAEKGTTTLKVYDILGKEISTLVNEELGAGEHKVIFNAANYASGVYFYRINSGTFTQSRKMILLK
jgi:subtilisin family serine protease